MRGRGHGSAGHGSPTSSTHERANEHGAHSREHIVRPSEGAAPARHNRARPEDVALGEGRRTQKHCEPLEPLGGARRAIQLAETGRGSRAQARAGGERGQCSARRFGLGKRRRVPVAVAAARRRDVLRAAERALRTARHLSCRVCFNTTKRSNLLDQKTC